MGNRLISLSSGPTLSRVTVSPADLQELRAALRAWYATHARDLPWRAATRDPYAIWVSEVMLQQTRVETVKPYFERFLARWPTVRDLARADPDEVRACWSGLGYYRRARALMDAAALIVERHGGEIPAQAEALAALPGFGRYTTGAVASIAFDQPVAAVDGNVSRVLARVFAIEGDVTKGDASRQIWSIASALALGEAPGQLNQALIELGATVCGRRPSCGQCPIQKSCRAFADDRVEEIPTPRRRAEVKVVTMTAVILSDGTSVLLELQPEGGLFGGLFCPPLLEGEQTPAEAKSTLERSWGIEVEELRPVGSRTHLLTHRRIESSVLFGRPRASHAQRGRFAPLAELGRFGLPSLTVKLLRAGLPPHELPAHLPGRRTGRSDQMSLPTLGDTP